MSILSIINSPKAIAPDKQKQSPLLSLSNEVILMIFSKLDFSQLLSCRVLCKKAAHALGLYPLCYRLKELKDSAIKNEFKHETEVMMEAMQLEVSLYSLEKIRREKKEEFFNFDLSKYLTILLKLAEIAESSEAKKSLLEEAKEIILSDTENESADVLDQEPDFEREPMEPLIFFKETLLITIAKLEVAIDLEQAEKTLQAARNSLVSTECLFFNHIFKKCQDSGFCFVATLINIAQAEALFDKISATLTLESAKAKGRMMELNDGWNILENLELSIAAVEFLIVPDITKRVLLIEEGKEDEFSDKDELNFKMEKARLLFEIGAREEATKILNEVKEEDIKRSYTSYLSDIAQLEAEVLGNRQIANATLEAAKKGVEKMEMGLGRDQQVFEIAKVEATLDLLNVKNAQAAAKTMTNKREQLIVTLKVLNTAAKVWQTP